MRVPTYRKGMTLVELMIVIVVVSVLSLLAVTGYRKYTFRARNTEAKQFLQAIRAAQEVYYQSFGQYCGSTQPSRWPAQIPTTKTAWGDPVPLAWQHLGIKTPGYVEFQYELRAGSAQDNGGPSFDEQPERPWFVAVARGDFLRGDGNKTSFFEITSETEHVYSENENH